MAKVKIFKFEVSNHGFNLDARKRLVSDQEIENQINDFIKDKELVSIQANTIEEFYHNNGCNNTVQLIYTIVYKDIE